MKEKGKEKEKDGRVTTGKRRRGTEMPPWVGGRGKTLSLKKYETPSKTAGLIRLERRGRERPQFEKGENPACEKKIESRSQGEKRGREKTHLPSQKKEKRKEEKKNAVLFDYRTKKRERLKRKEISRLCEKEKMQFEFRGAGEGKEKRNQEPGCGEKGGRERSCCSDLNREEGRKKRGKTSLVLRLCRGWGEGDESRSDGEKKKRGKKRQSISFYASLIGKEGKREGRGGKANGCTPDELGMGRREKAVEGIKLPA